jgi:D-lactate dehydrogenase
MAFASKGFKETGDRKAAELNDALLQISRQGEYPVLCDMSPCLYRMKETLDPRLKLYEPIEFTLLYLIERLQFVKKAGTIAIHPVCSAKKMGLEEKFIQLASLCAEQVVVPENNCCGFAGDRGFTVPELNAHGLRNLKNQLPESCTAGYSTSRTCEIGLSYHSGLSYQSILYLVDACTVAKIQPDK